MRGVRMVRNKYTMHAAPKFAILRAPEGRNPGGHFPNWDRHSPALCGSPQAARDLAQLFLMNLCTHELAWPANPENKLGPVCCAVRCVIFAPRKYTAADHAMISA